MNSKIIIGVVIVVVAINLFIGWVMYQSMVVIPREEIAAEKQAEAVRVIAEERHRNQIKYEFGKCNDLAYANYSRNWETTCEGYGKEEECTLPTYLSKGLNDDYSKEREACLAVFKAQ